MRARLAIEQNGYDEDSDTSVECPHFYDVFIRKGTSTVSHRGNVKCLSLIAPIVLRKQKVALVIILQFFQGIRARTPKADKYTRNTSREAKVTLNS